eukprot:gene6299-7550_t
MALLRSWVTGSSLAFGGVARVVSRTTINTAMVNDTASAAESEEECSSSSRVEAREKSDEPESQGESHSAEETSFPSAEKHVAGLEASLAALRELVTWPVKYRTQAAHFGVSWPRGLLLHGPPGVGKTLLVKSVAEEAGAALHMLTAGNVFGSYAGESERRVRDAFEACDV